MVVPADLPKTIRQGKFSQVGAGIREKQIGPAVIKGYVVGFYVDTAQLGTIASSLNLGSSASPEVAAEAVKAILKSPKVDKALYMHIARDIPFSRVRGAFKDALNPRTNDAGKLKIPELISFLSPKSNGFKKNAVIELLWEKDDLSVLVNGDRSGLVDDRAFAEAMFNVYLDKKTISPSMRNDVHRNIPAIVGKAAGGKEVPASKPIETRPRSVSESKRFSFIRLGRRKSTLSVVSTEVSIEEEVMSPSEPSSPATFSSVSEPRSPTFTRSRKLSSSPVQAGLALYNKAMPRFARLKSIDYSQTRGRSQSTEQ